MTGGVTSYFSLLYVLPIIAAASLMRRRGALMVAALSSLLYAGLVAAAVPGTVRRAPAAWIVAPAELPAPRVALYLVGIDIVAFLAVGALAGSLAERLRRAGASLENASTEIANLQAFSKDVIESLTSGLVTTDIAGRILSFNHAAETITGHQADTVDRPRRRRRAPAARRRAPAAGARPRGRAQPARRTTCIRPPTGGRSRSAWRSPT